MRGRPPRTVVAEPPANRDDDLRPKQPLAAGSEQFGRTLPEGVASALRRIEHQKQRDESATVPFGNSALRIEHRYGVVTVTLADGTRVTGTPEQAAELARVLLARTKP